MVFRCKPELHPRMRWIKKRSLNFSELLNSEENDSDGNKGTSPEPMQFTSTPAPNKTNESFLVLPEIQSNKALVNPLSRRNSFFPIFSNVLLRGFHLDSSEEMELGQEKEKKETKEKVIESIGLAQKNNETREISAKEEADHTSSRSKRDALDKEERKRLRMERREKRKMNRRKKGRGKAFGKGLH